MQVDSLSAEPQEKPKNIGVGSLSLLQRISQPRNRIGVSWFFTNWAIREALRDTVIKQTVLAYLDTDFFKKPTVIKYLNTD